MPATIAETGFAFAITKHTSNQIYVQAMILWAKQFILMSGHPSADCLPTWLTGWLHSATNAQSLAYVTAIAQFWNKRIRKQRIAFFITMVLLKALGHYSRVHAVLFFIRKGINCTAITTFYTLCSLFLLFVTLSLMRFLDHTQRPTSIGRTPLDGWSACRRDLYVTTHSSPNRMTAITPARFEPTISAGERPQTYALERATTGNGNSFLLVFT